MGILFKYYNENNLIENVCENILLLYNHIFEKQIFLSKMTLLMW